MLRFLPLLLAVSLAFAARPAAAYSVLTHQANIDSTWERSLMPALQRRYPGGTPEEMADAKAYAYGGAIIQDMGYYPFGNVLFTNLTHYVRSGDFVRSLINQSENRNDYAFAMGALAHYAADISGHAEGTNRALASVYPDLAKKFGPVITYEQAPKQHTQLEFAFDVVQLASGKYHTQEYHKNFGFKVSKSVLERAFLQTYGLELGKVIANVDLSIASFRFAVSQLIPTAARAAWHYKRQDIMKLSPGAKRRDYLERISSRQFRKEYGNEYERPGFGARIISYFVRVLPKIGPLKPFAFKLPTPEAQALFKASFQTVLVSYRADIARQPADTSASPLALPNTDFDTGRPTRAGAYALADETYGQWVRMLSKDKFEKINPRARQNILAFYNAGIQIPASEEEKEASKLRETQEALVQLRALK
ncbi:zinc dependent phospholipase C family protein [Hymenobacter sp. BT683]|uniref:Zinc dependent phospholipase C family protein n=1 Tax=Hymenobacter jeongseonensis TaxID=2791027 RepID=A0ABS0IEB6_9BACT|nr:zinc dependent phospholipase C family protein [Hymenobacter jeongseonensis]MBF9236650.1 zinc dependent phospholipase C family protein [Hymenobacter jeongseonensis]